MVEKFVTLDAQTYESLQQELVALRQQVACLKQARSSERSQMAHQQSLAIQVSRINHVATHLPGAMFQFTSRDGVWRVDYISDGLFQLAGITAADMMQDFNRFIERVHPDDLNAYIASVVEAVENATPWHYQGRLIKPNGEIRWWQGDSTPTKNENGEVVFCGLLLDISDRIAAETALQQSEAQIRLLFRHTPGAIAMFDREMRYLLASPRWQEEYNLGDQCIIGRSHYEIFPEIPEYWKKIHQRCLAGATEKCDEEAFPRADGTVDWVKWEVRPWYDAQGEIGGIIMFTEVITARKRAEEALRQLNEELEARVEERTQQLRESEARYQKLAANIPGMIAQFGLAPDGTKSFPYASPGCRQLLELEPEEALKIFDLVHPDDLADLEERILHSAQTLEAFEHKWRIITPSGKLKWLHTISRPEQQPDGAIVWDGITLDITDRRQAEIERDRFFNISTDILCIAGFDGYFKRINPSFTAILGYRVEELFAKPFLDFVHPEDREATLAEAAKISQGATTIYFENRYRCKDGSYKWLSWNSVPFTQDQVIYAIARDITEGKQAAQVLENQRRRLSLLIEQSPLAVIEWNANLEVVAWNQAAEAIFGYTQQEAMGCNGSELILPPKEQQKLRPFLQQMLSGTGGTYSVNENRTKDGKIIICEWHNKQLVDTDGEVIGVVSLAQDISDRIEAQEALRISEERFRLVAEQTGQLIYDYELTSGKLNWAGAIEKITGYTFAEFQRVNIVVWAAHLHPDDRQLVLELLEQAMQDGTHYHAEYRFRQKDGSYIYLEDNGAFLKDENGVADRMVGTMSDITARKQAEHALRETTQKFQEAQRIAHIGNWDFDVDTGEIFWSDQVFHIFGLEPGQPIPTFPELVQKYHPEDQNLFQQLVTQAVSEAKTYDSELRIIHPDGAVRYIHARGEFSCNEENRVVRLFGTVMDISDRKQAEIQLRQKAQDLEKALHELQRTQTQLVQSEKMSSLGQLVAGVAHEINNPVNFIYGNLVHANEYAEALLDVIQTYQQYYPNPVLEVQEVIEDADLDFLMEDLPKLLNSMQVGAIRIREIIASLRNFSRIDEAECKQVNLHDGIDSTLMILHNRIKVKPDKPAIEVVQKYGDLPLVECYPGQLNQVFMNILVNAIDALEERDQQRTTQEIKQNPSIIRITTEFMKSEQKVSIKIQDNGQGIPEAVRNRIFDPFFTTKPVGKGTGLGMSISYQIVTEKHNGTLECISSPGNGAEFVIQLPISISAVEKGLLGNIAAENKTASDVRF